MKKESVQAEVVQDQPTQKGRPVNPTSARQLRLAEMEAKRANGELKRGRPIVQDSARQLRLAALEAKRANGELQRGRPANPNSARQLRIAEMEAKRAAGELHRGRPKSITVVAEPIVEEVVAPTKSKRKEKATS